MPKKFSTWYSQRITPDEGDGANVLAHNAAFNAELPVEPPEPRRTGIRFRM
jgi:hypothetical protein